MSCSDWWQSKGWKDFEPGSKAFSECGRVTKTPVDDKEREVATDDLNLKRCTFI